MGRSWAVSLMLGVAVSAGLLGLYHFTPFFYEKVVQLEDFYHKVFVLPVEGALAFYVPLQYAYLTLISFLSAWVCIELPRKFNKIAFLAGAMFLTAIMSPVLAFCGILFEPLSGLIAVFLAGVGGFIFGDSENGRRRHQLYRYFVGRITTDNFERITGAGEAGTLTGKKEMTVLTCRILNYPELTSQMEASDLQKMGSLFLRVAGEFLVSKGAYLDNCTADGVRVLFGLIEGKEANHALEGSHAALELKQRLTNLEQEIQNRWHRKPIFGVALATGPMSTGLFGFREFEFYSAVGEALDFSRRLCPINLVYGSYLLLGARTFHMIKDQMETRPMEMVYAPKLHQLSEVYELLAVKGTLSEEEVKARDAFWQGVVSLRKGAYKDAVQQLMKAQLDSREDPPLKYFMERAEAGLKDDRRALDLKGSAKHIRMLTVN